MSLTFIPPTIIDREKVVKILVVVIAKDKAKWKFALIVYVIGTSPSIGAMERFILAQGETVKELEQVSQPDQTTVQERKKVVDEIIANREEWQVVRNNYANKRVYQGNGIDEFISPMGNNPYEIVYGLYTIKARSVIWTSLRNLELPTTEAWLIMGNFNSVSQEDIEVGNQVQEYELRDFRNFMEDCNMSELPSTDRSFTWTNGHVYSRIDKALVNTSWYLNMSTHQVQMLDPVFSDHSLLCLDMGEAADIRKRPFKFYNCLA
ncbi:hypothetical protein P3S68_021680 [Capsicum galapagoense]